MRLGRVSLLPSWEYPPVICTDICRHACSFLKGKNSVFLALGGPGAALRVVWLIVIISRNVLICLWGKAEASGDPPALWV